MNNVIKGTLVALILFGVALILVSLFRSDWGNPFDYLSRSYSSKAITLDVLFASIPNVLLFFYLTSKNELSLARGVQVVVICILVFMMIVRFLL